MPSGLPDNVLGIAKRRRAAAAPAAPKVRRRISVALSPDQLAQLVRLATEETLANGKRVSVDALAGRLLGDALAKRR